MKIAEKYSSFSSSVDKQIINKQEMNLKQKSDKFLMDLEKLRRKILVDIPNSYFYLLSVKRKLS